MTLWIVLAFLFEEYEPCFMNIATVGPVLFCIGKRIYYQVGSKCCNVVSLGIGLYLIGFSIWSCSCNVDCGNLHIAVILVVALWAFISIIGHAIHLKEKVRQEKSNYN